MTLRPKPHEHLDSVLFPMVCEASGRRLKDLLIVLSFVANAKSSVPMAVLVLMTDMKKAVKRESYFPLRVEERVKNTVPCTLNLKTICCSARTRGEEAFINPKGSHSLSARGHWKFTR